jgi:class 3 adenylate cyclase
MTTADSTCSACGTELRASARFCDGCGSPVAPQKSAEYKQVTVLFADVVHSMDIAAAVGPERLREIMTTLFDRCAATVQRYGGTVDKFTGDGIMAVFGAPIALEDHAVRSCLAALDIQKEMRGLTADVQAKDGIDLQLRVGLNSGEVIAGEIGSGAWGYTAVGHQVGMAQRMESVFGWHMRAATWLTRRDMRAARASWQRARQVADQLPGDTAGRTAMRISPRSLLCVTAWRVGGSVDDTGFDELHELASAAGDKTSLAVGMAGQVFALAAYGRYREACTMVPELLNLGDSVGNPTLTAALLMAALTARFGTGELTEVMRLTQRIIDDTDADPETGNFLVDSPLTVALMQRAAAGMCKGLPGWRAEVDRAVPLCAELEPGIRAALMLYVYGIGVANGLLLPDAAMLRASAEALRAAEERGDEFALAFARFLRGLILVQHDDPQRAEGLEFAWAVTADCPSRSSQPGRLAAAQSRTRQTGGARR